MLLAPATAHSHWTLVMFAPTEGDEPAVTQSAAAAAPGPVLTVVVPTFNERDNVAELTRRLNMRLSGVEGEGVFVDDDSPDGTGEAIHALGRADRRVRCLRRIGRRALSSACMEGM